MILLATLAWADPVALRAPVDGVVVVGGLPQVGAGAWFGDHLGVAATWDVRGRAGDVAVAGRWDLTRAASGFGVDGGVAGGLGVSVLGPDPFVEVAPWVGVGWRRPAWHVVLDLAVPAAFGVGGPDVVRLPVLVEPWVGGTVGDWSLTLGAGLGQVVVPGALPAVALRWQAGLAWRPAPPRSGAP